MGLDLGIFLTYAGAIILVFIFGRLFLWPLKVVLKLVINSLIGGAVILIINAAAGRAWYNDTLKYAQCLLY